MVCKFFLLGVLRDFEKDCTFAPAIENPIAIAEIGFAVVRV